MNTIATILLFCVQVCLVQNVFGQCHGSYGPAIPPAGYGPPGLGPLGYPGYADYGYPGAEWATPYGCGLDAYGGIGEGNVAVAGELPVAGTTAVAGQVPIMGAVRFGGDIPAAGVVTITGNCACGCGVGVPYIY